MCNWGEGGARNRRYEGRRDRALLYVWVPVVAAIYHLTIEVRTLRRGRACPGRYDGAVRK